MIGRADDGRGVMLSLAIDPRDFRAARNVSARIAVECEDGGDDEPYECPPVSPCWSREAVPKFFGLPLQALFTADLRQHQVAWCSCYLIPEFGRAILELLRQPLEAGRVTVARANHHVTYPARFQLVAAMNPCRCGHLDNPALACARAPRCARDYQGRISGPLLDRIDLQVEVPALRPGEIAAPAPGEPRATVAARVARAREIQAERFSARTNGEDPGRAAIAHAMSAIRTNAEADGALLDAIATPDAAGRDLLLRATERMHLTARGWHRVLRVARTIADLDGQAQVARPHIAEALSFRRIAPNRQ